jgi:DNA helicase-2/ATP-dependent DNA helicase PcrA
MRRLKNVILSSSLRTGTISQSRSSSSSRRRCCESGSFLRRSANNDDERRSGDGGLLRRGLGRFHYSALAATTTTTTDNRKYEGEDDFEKRRGKKCNNTSAKSKKNDDATAKTTKSLWAQTASEAIPNPETLLTYRCAENLSNAQASAVLSPNPSFVRVLAGPGSGKTHVLVSRVQHLIEDQNVLPENILCITFTNKAAKELRNRLEKAMGAEVSRAITAGTFHAVAARILRKHVDKLHEELERTSDFTIYDSDDSKSVVRDILVEKLGQSKKSAAPLPMKNFISAAKSSMKTSVNVNARTAMDSALRMKARKGNSNSNFDDDDSNDGRGRSSMMASSSSSGIALLREQFDIVWSEYEQKLREANSFDFDDLLSTVVYLFENRPDAKRYLQNRWSHVLVDEFQDTSLAQYEMIRHLGERAETLFVVGDADQAIYGWRGAEVSNIRSRFDDDFRNAQTFRLTTNYRSTATIVSAARAVIQQSEIPSALMSWDAIKEGGQDVAVVEAGDEREEGAFIAMQVKQMLEDAEKKTASNNRSSDDDSLEGLRKKDIAVLYRTNTQARALEEAFVRAGVPHVVVGDQSFYGRKEIKDLIAYLRVASNSSDGVSLRRIINTPTRGIGEKTIEKLEEWVSRCEAPSLGAALFDRAWATNNSSDDPDHAILPSAKEIGISARARNSVLAFAKTLIEIRKTADTVTNPGEVLKKVIAMTDYENYVKDKDDASERWDHVAELIQLATDAEENLAENDIEGDGTNAASKNPKTTLAAFLEGVSLLSSSEATHGNETFDDEEDESRKERADAVKLMTLHASKGAEFDVVFIAGCEDGLTPSARANESAEERDEEVRLFYVGVTRAKKKLFLCHASTRRRFGSKPEVRTRSPFVDAIAEALGQSGNSNVLKPKVPKSAKPARKNTSTFDWKKRIVVDVNQENINGGGGSGDDEKARRLRRARQSVAKATGLDGANSIEF